MDNQFQLGVNTSINELLALRRQAKGVLKPNNVCSSQAGGHRSRMRGRGIDFSETRSYQAGDDIRHMDWRVTARTGVAHTKLYHEERERPIFILVDFSESMFFGTLVAYKSVIAARLAAMLAFSSSHDGDRVGGIVFSGDNLDELKPRARSHGVLPLLQKLSDYSLAPKRGARGLTEAVIRLRRVVRPGSLVFVLSDFYHIDSELIRHLSRIQQHNDVVGLYIHDEIEQAPPSPAMYAVTDGERELLLDTRKRSTRRQYSEHFHQHHDNIVELFKQGFLLDVKTSDPLSAILRQAFSLIRHRRR